MTDLEFAAAIYANACNIAAAHPETADNEESARRRLEYIRTA